MLGDFCASSRLEQLALTALGVLGSFLFLFLLRGQFWLVGFGLFVRLIFVRHGILSFFRRSPG